MVTAATALPDQSQPVGVSERSGQKPVCGGHAALAWLFSIALENPPPVSSGSFVLPRESWQLKASVQSACFCSPEPSCSLNRGGEPFSCQGLHGYLQRHSWALQNYRFKSSLAIDMVNLEYCL